MASKTVELTRELWVQRAIKNQIAYQREHPYTSKTTQKVSDPTRVHQAFVGLLGTDVTLSKAFMASWDASRQDYIDATDKASDMGLIVKVGPREHPYRTLTLPEFAGDRGKNGAVTRELDPGFLASLIA